MRFDIEKGHTAMWVTQGVCILLCVTTVFASENTGTAELKDSRLKKFFSTRTSLTSDLKDLQVIKDQSKAQRHKKQVDVNQRSSLLAHNIDSRYPTVIGKRKKPQVIRELDRAQLIDAYVDPLTIKAEIVSPVKDKKMTLPKKKVPNFSRPLRCPEEYDSVTGQILKDYYQNSN